MKLSEAILRGCKMTPKQAFGELVVYEPIKATCVLGAAKEGIGWEKELRHFFPELYVADYALYNQIRLLNDKQRWSRERIAGWLAEKGL